MQRSLGFPSITAHDAAQQRQRIATAAANAASNVEPPAPPPLKRPVGRPKRARDVADALLQDTDEPDAKSSARRGQYTKWFASPYINDIFAAYRRCNSKPQATVKLLQREAPDDRYARLTHTTIMGWFCNGELLPHLQNQLKANQAPRGNGPASALAAAPEVESEIVMALCHQRESGTPLNSRIIRVIMRAIIAEKAPALLTTMKLSQQFISKWVRNKLEWTWRARTTAASKLPCDWEAQGIQMSMRIGANMALHRVRTYGARMRL
jgi:hypothetical protein